MIDDRPTVTSSKSSVAGQLVYAIGVLTAARIQDGRVGILQAEAQAGAFQPTWLGQDAVSP